MNYSNATAKALITLTSFANGDWLTYPQAATYLTISFISLTAQELVTCVDAVNTLNTKKAQDKRDEANAIFTLFDLKVNNTVYKAVKTVTIEGFQFANLNNFEQLVVKQLLTVKEEVTTTNWEDEMVFVKEENAFVRQGDLV